MKLIANKVFIVLFLLSINLLSVFHSNYLLQSVRVAQSIQIVMPSMNMHVALMKDHQHIKDQSDSKHQLEHKQHLSHCDISSCALYLMTAFVIDNASIARQKVPSRQMDNLHLAQNFPQFRPPKLLS